MKILVVEDEVELANSLVSFFKKSGYTTLHSSDLFEAEDKILLHQFDLIILDINLPDGNGLNLIDRIKKEQENAGILIVSARNSLDDKVTGLDLGADDYITKPFHLSELLSRVKAIDRRKHGGNGKKISFNEIDIHLDEQQVYVNQHPLELTKKEYELLLFFINNSNRVLTKESIIKFLWGEEIESSDNFDFIYTHIKNLRKKITDQKGADYLKTVYGMGYKFTDQ